MGYDGENENPKVDKQFLSSPVKNLVDKFQLLPEFLKVRGLVKQHLDSYNYLIRTDIKKIVRANNEIRSAIDPSIFLRYTDVWIGEPSMIIDGATEKLTPHQCRQSDTTSVPIFILVSFVIAELFPVGCALGDK
nr:DNA-directed RNA polymerase III subunit 2 [Ipomoea batatas]